MTKNKVKAPVKKVEPPKKPTKKKIAVVTKRPTPDQFRKLCDKHGRLKAVISVGLAEMTQLWTPGDPVGPEDPGTIIRLAEDRIVPESIGSALEDVTFKAVGIVSGGTRILIEFRADASTVLTEIEHPEPESDDTDSCGGPEIPGTPVPPSPFVNNVPDAIP